MKVHPRPFDGKTDGHICSDGIEHYEGQGEKDKAEEFRQSGHMCHVYHLPSHRKKHGNTICMGLKSRCLALQNLSCWLRLNCPCLPPLIEGHNVRRAYHLGRASVCGKCAASFLPQQKPWYTLIKHASTDRHLQPRDPRWPSGHLERCHDSVGTCSRMIQWREWRAYLDNARTTAPTQSPSRLNAAQPYCGDSMTVDSGKESSISMKSISESTLRVESLSDEFSRTG